MRQEASREQYQDEARIALPLLPFSFFFFFSSPGFNFGPGTVRAKALKEPSVKKHFLYSKNPFYDVTCSPKGLTGRSMLRLSLLFYCSTVAVKLSRLRRGI